MHWFKNVIFEKNSLSPFWGCWGQEVIFEVAEAKFWISSSFYKFSFIIFVVFGFNSHLTWQPENFFKNVIFEISAFQRKRWVGNVSAFWSKFSLNLSTENDACSWRFNSKPGNSYFRVWPVLETGNWKPWFWNPGLKTLILRCLALKQ